VAILFVLFMGRARFYVSCPPSRSVVHAGMKAGQKVSFTTLMGWIHCPIRYLSLLPNVRDARGSCDVCVNAA
ncbi:hypothetical protein, partial [Sansalvadorimonas verongulae]|uniref:hypothetical protein n=1 Tax=Sansalvadorimonas verongulae TaxID=2172824 RepID=UPI001E3C005B